jgi:hypothetical protein
MRLTEQQSASVVLWIGHPSRRLVVEITPTVVKRYQTHRLAEKAWPKQR